MYLLWTLLSGQFIIHVSCQGAARPSFTERAAWSSGDWAFEDLELTKEEGAWNEYISTMGWNYIEDPDVRKKEEELNPTRRSQDPFPEIANLVQTDWQPMTAHDVPYMAIIYRSDSGKPSKEFENLFGPDRTMQSHVEPNTACGGAFMTTKHVLTSCACVLTFVAEVFKMTPVFPPGIKRYSNGLRGYDIYDPEASDHPGALYVDPVAGTRFSPRFHNRVSVYPEDWSKIGASAQNPIGAALTCTAMIKRLQGINPATVDSATITAVNTEIAVLPFSPPIVPDWPNFFPGWPPLGLDEKTDPTLSAHATVCSIGMRVSTKLGFDFDSSKHAVSISMQHCTGQCPSAVCPSTPRKPTGERWICFKAPRYSSISGGTIGWPVVWKGILIGITVTERDERDSTVLVSLIRVDAIPMELYMGRNVLRNQNTPPPSYRQTQLPLKYFIYDYDVIERARPRSLEFASGTMSPKPIFRCLIMVVWFSNI